MWFGMLRDGEECDEEAIELLQRSMELDPLGRIPYTNLPSLSAQRGQNDEAIRLWLKAMEIHPEWPIPMEYLAQQLAGLGRLDEAAAWVERAGGLSGDPTPGLLNVRLFIALGDIERAEHHLAMATRLSMGGSVEPAEDEVLVQGAVIDADESGHAVQPVQSGERAGLAAHQALRRPPVLEGTGEHPVVETTTDHGGSHERQVTVPREFLAPGSRIAPRHVAAHEHRVRQLDPLRTACFVGRGAFGGGVVDIQFTVGSSGQVSKATVIRNSTGSKALGGCIAGAFKRWRFPRPVGGEMEFIYPFVFASGG